MDKETSGRDHQAMNTHLLIQISFVFFAAGVVKGISGMGLPTLSMALLSLIMPPASAATVMLLPSLLTNIAQCMGPHWRMLTRRLWPLWLSLVLATTLCPLPGLGSANSQVHVALAGILVAYGVWGLIKPNLPDPGRHASIAGAMAGTLSGLLTASTGVFVIPLVPYLQSLRLSKSELMQALGLSFTLATLALAARLSHVAAITWTVPSTVAIMGAFIGLWMGSALRGHLEQATFQRALYSVFILLGLLMLGRLL